MPRKTTDKTATKIRKCWAGRYEWVRRCDGAVIMEAEQGVLDHDPKAWQITFYCYSECINAWRTSDNDVTYTLREAKDLVQGWAEGLVATNDQGWGPSREY